MLQRIRDFLGLEDRSGITRQAGTHLGLKGTFELSNLLKPRELDCDLIPFRRLWGARSERYQILHEAYMAMKAAGALTPHEYRRFQKKRS